MRTLHVLLASRVSAARASAAGSVALATAAAAAPPLALFADGFPAGLYAESAGVAGGPRKICLRTADPLLSAGRPLGPACRVTVLEDSTERATISWTCPDGASGRSDIRRDHAGLFTVRSQGVAGRLPFSETRAYRRIGDC